MRGQRLRLVVATPILFGVVGIAMGEAVYFTVFGVATGNLGRPRQDSVSSGIEFNA